MFWNQATWRVTVAAVEAHPQDVVADLGCGDGAMLREWGGRIGRGIGVDRDGEAIRRARELQSAQAGAQAGRLEFVQADLEDVGAWWRPEISVVVMHDTLRLLPVERQRRLLAELGRRMAARGLLVVGDVMWSMPVEVLEAPEQYGEPLAHAQPAAAVEQMARAAGFLPDLHRFGPGRAVLVALRAG